MAATTKKGAWLRLRVREYTEQGLTHFVRFSPTGYPIACVRYCWSGLSIREAAQRAEEVAALALTKRSVSTVPGAVSAGLSCGWSETRYPDLWEHLTHLTFSTGETRETSSLLIFQQDGMLKAMLRDRANGQCLWVAARGLLDLLGVLQAALADPAADWREDRAKEGGKATRVSKRPG